MDNKIYLTDREKEILIYLAKGYTNKELGKFLNISFHTVKSHLETIYQKLNTKNKIQTVFFAHKAGLIDINKI